ncbi:MAG: cation:proton antiporter [Acidimicrobiales bacterium]
MYFLASATSSETTNAIAIVMGGGVACLWLASRLKVPAILLLLPAGVLAGPVFGLLDPDEQFGSVLFPGVSLGVGLLLFEGGLSLRFDRIGSVKSVTARMVTVGAFITWLIGMGAISVLFDIGRGLTALMAALLIVSGPTVVQPLLRMAKPRSSISEVLRWEGIVIDPIGATLGVVVLDSVLHHRGFVGSAYQIFVTLGAGGVIGLVAGVALSYLLGRHAVPDYLQNPLALVIAIGAFAVAEMVSSDAGLMATTMLGLVLANQKQAPTRHIRDFQEELSLLVLGALFLVLGARVDLDEIVDVFPKAVVLVLVLVVVARPVAVAASTVGSGMTTRERMFIAVIMPRGIVAAAVSAVFALELEQAGIDPGPLVPVTFSVIVLTVLLYGLTAVPMARLLRVARPAPTGVAIVGADAWHLQLATRLQDADIPIMLFTDRAFERRRAEKSLLLVFDGRLQGEELHEAADAVGIRTVLVLTDRTELATAVVGSLGHYVGRANLFALDRGFEQETGVATALAARPAFSKGFSSDVLDAALAGGGTLVTVPSSDIEPGDLVLAGITAGVASFDGTHGVESIVCRPVVSVEEAASSSR